MKKSVLKKILCLCLVLLMTLTFIPIKTYAASVAPSGFAMMRQTDSRWLNYSFNGGTLYATGCGIFSLANCVGYLTGQTMDVVEVATWAHNNGMYNVNGADGTYRTSFYPAASKRYGATYNITIDCSDGSGYWSSVNNSKLKNHLINGGVAVAHVYNHFIALVGYNPSNDTFHVWDCAPRDRRGTLSSNGDIWFSTNHLTTATYMTIDWFALVSLATPEETWIEKSCFDADVYKSKYADLKNMTNAELKDHWLNHGRKEGRCASAVYDPYYYLEQNKDLADAFGTDFEKLYQHFITTGYKEQRKSSRLFDGEYYCKKYPDVAATYKLDYLRHYIDYGMKEGRRGSSLFNVEYYLFIRPDVAEMWPGDLAAAARHYASHGVNEGIVAYDNQPPVISEVKVHDVSDEGYTISCKITDNWGISNVCFPTWTILNNQDDLANNWQETTAGTKNGDTYTYIVKASDHNGENGIYATHIYATDKEGNEAKYEISSIELKEAFSEITLINSSKYVKNENIISKISSATEVKTFLKEFENSNLKVKDLSGKEMSSSALIGTGASVELYDGSSLVDKVFVIVLGDVDGNGIVDGTDYLRVKSKFLENMELDSYQSLAADVDGNGSIDGTDYIRIKGQFLGTFSI